MFTAFANGQVDLTDWPIFAGDLLNDQSNVNMFVTNAQPSYGIFQMDIQGHWSLLGINQLAARPTTTPGLQGSLVFTAGGCAGAGIADIKINLVNLETGSSVIADSNNQALLNFAKDGSVFDKTNPAPSGFYDFGCVVLSTLASNTAEPVSTSVYAGIGSLNLVNAACAGATGCTVTATLGVNYASISNSKLTPAGTQFREGIAHLLGKQEFVQGEFGISGVFHACAMDEQGTPAQGLDRVPGPPGCMVSEDPDSPNSAECADPGIAAEHTALGETCSPFSLYNLDAFSVSPPDLWWTTAGAISGYPAYEDIYAACVHFNEAGLVVVNGAGPSDCAGVANSLSTIDTSTCFTVCPNTLATPPPCAGGTAGPDNCPHLNPHSIAGSLGHLWVIIRSEPARKHFGQIIADGLNALFGTPQSQGGGVVCYNWTTISGGSGPCVTAPGPGYTIGEIATVVFGDGSGANCGSGSSAVCDTWNLYTGGFAAGTVPDQFYTTYDSAFGSTACGGSLASFPGDYVFHCDPAFDSQAQGGEFSTTSTVASNLFQVAADMMAQSSATIPVYVPLVSFGANNGYSYQGKSISTSLVSQKGNGWGAGSAGQFWSLLNMRQVPGYIAPGGAAFQPGCAPFGVPQIQCIRDGMSQNTDVLNFFSGGTVWDFTLMGEVYDSMLAPVPGTGGFPGATNPTPEQLIDWMTISHSSTFNPNEITCVGAPVNTVPVCVQGTTTQTWNLRPDLFFHDGAAVTAADVAYSILAYRDVSSISFASLVANVPTDKCTGSLTATGTCNGALQAIPGAEGDSCPTTLGLGGANPDGSPVGFIKPCQATAIPGSGFGPTCPAPCNAVKVKLQGQSVLFNDNIGGLPILPQHIWQNGANSMIGCGIMPFPGGGGPCSSPALDSMATGNFVGSGPMMCVSSTGHIGGPCTSTGTQTTTPGPAVLFRAFGCTKGQSTHCGYMRGPTPLPGSSYQTFSWVDPNNDGAVGLDDLASMAVVFCDDPTVYPSPATQVGVDMNGKPIIHHCASDAYWGNPSVVGTVSGCPVADNGCPGAVTATALATIALYYGISLTRPYSPGVVTNIDPNLDYYDYTGLGGGVFYGCPPSSVTVGGTTTSFTCYSDSPPGGVESLTVADSNLNPTVGASCSEIRMLTVPDRVNPIVGYVLGKWTCTVNNPLPPEVKLIYVPGAGAAASPFGVSRMPYYIFNH
jgi:ABC-type transport system substrate-binding protein